MTTEELVFGDISTGARDDLQRATDLARHMITQYGMSRPLGPGTFEEPRTSAFLDIPMAHGPREYSARTAQGIDEEIAKLLTHDNQRVTGTLTERRPALDALTKLLLEKEVVDRTTLDRLATRWLLKTGVPHEEIVETAAEVGADYIVMGTPGRGALARWLLGSVAEASAGAVRPPLGDRGLGDPLTTTSGVMTMRTTG